MIERKISWKDIWQWETARLSFLIRSTYDVLPSPSNLKRWKLSQDDLCKCGQKGTVKHVLSHCPLGLDRRTWRHNQVLKVLDSAFSRKIEELSKGNVPSIEKVQKIKFVRQGMEPSGKSKKKMVADERWAGVWKLAADLDSPLVFPIVATAQRPDLVLWNEERQKAVLMELTVSWEDNIKAAEERKYQRYEKLVERCEEAGWEMELYHIGVGARGYIDKAFVHLLRARFGFNHSETTRLMTEIQKTVEKASMWLWMKREDENWNEIE